MKQSKTPLELAFDAIVLAAGGHITSELHPYQQLKARGCAPLDADYFFPAHETVAELKRLERDTFKVIEDPRLTKMGHDWVRRGLIHRPTTNRLRWFLPDLPMECQREAMSFFKAPVEKVISSANDQIKSTKTTLGLPDRTRGLLLLASDGNRVIFPEALICILARIFKGPYFSSIHSIAYFTFEVLANAPSINEDTAVWIDMRTRDDEGVPRVLLSDIANRWGECLESKFGRKMRRVTDQSILADLKFPPKKKK
jgi:hypothetical protein